jgi:hypothetical protein
VRPPLLPAIRRSRRFISAQIELPREDLAQRLGLRLTTVTSRETLWRLLIDADARRQPLLALLGTLHGRVHPPTPSQLHLPFGAGDLCPLNGQYSLGHCLARLLPRNISQLQRHLLLHLRKVRSAPGGQ